MAAEPYGPKVVVDLEHGRAIEPVAEEKILEMWEIKQRDADIREHAAAKQAKAEQAERKEQALETLRVAAKENSTLAPIAAAILELTGG